MTNEDIEKWVKKTLEWWSTVCFDVSVEGLSPDQVYSDKDACSDTVGDWLCDQGLEPTDIRVIKTIVLSRI